MNEYLSGPNGPRFVGYGPPLKPTRLETAKAVAVQAAWMFAAAMILVAL